MEGEEEDFDAVDSNGQAINIRNSFQPPRGYFSSLSASMNIYDTLSLRYSFLAVDYSQIELRVMAHLSDDKKLQQLFHAKSDVHSLVAQKCFSTILLHSRVFLKLIVIPFFLKKRKSELGRCDKRRA